jgi:DNA-binding winged helix-turn-helix (wHTH) protein
MLAGGVPVPIGARAFEIVEVLVRSANELVTKDDLLGRVWPGAAVGENTIQVHISAIGKAFGRDRAMLKTASGRGYGLLGQWTARSSSASLAPFALTSARTAIQPVQNNLPLAAVDLIGREAARGHLRDLASAYRIVTLTGSGGIGKMSLALQFAREMAPAFNGDVWLIELASLSDASLVAVATAGATHPASPRHIRGRLFVAGVTAVITSSESSAQAIADGILNLVAKSLVTADNTGGFANFRLLETTPAHALEKLAESNELQQFARKHAEYYRDLLAQRLTNQETASVRVVPRIAEARYVALDLQ